MATKEVKLNPLMLGFAGTSIVNGTSVNGYGTMDAENTSGSAALGSFRTDGRQSSIGWGGQLQLGIGLYFGEQAVLAMNTASGGSLISSDTAGNLRPLLQYQIPLLTASASRVTHCFIQSGTNDVGTGAIDATVTSTLTTHAANIFLACEKLIAAGIIPIIQTLPPKPSNANSHLQVIALNALLRSGAATRNIRVLDVYAALVSVDGLGYASGCGNADNIHATGPQVTFRMMEQCRKDLSDIYEPRRSVRALLGGNDILAMGGPNMVTAGTAPLTCTASGTGMAAALALPPVTFCEEEFGTRGCQASATGGNAQYLKRDCTTFFSSPGYVSGEEFIFSAIVEVTHNVPATTTHGFVCRLDWENTGGSSSGARVTLINGPQGIIPKTRLSVLFSTPSEDQIVALADLVKASFQCGQLSTDTGFLTWRVGDVKCVPVF
jgi:lysophospholipase L1-like esterase